MKKILAEFPFDIGNNYSRIASKRLYKSAVDTLSTISPDYKTGIIKIYGEKQFMSIGVEKREEIVMFGEPNRLACVYRVILLTGGGREILLCKEAVEELKLPDVFWVKIAKR